MLGKKKGLMKEIRWEEEVGIGKIVLALCLLSLSLSLHLSENCFMPQSVLLCSLLFHTTPRLSL
jgi:hypothetical protein